MQLFTVSFIVDHHVIPVIYALLPSKSTRVYDYFYKIVKKLIPGLRPETVITDFEKGSIVAFQKNFPNARLSGCLFHLGQTIQRHISVNGLSMNYANDNETRKFIKLLKCLVFVPHEKVRETYNHIRTKPHFPHILEGLYQYFFP